MGARYTDHLTWPQVVNQICENIKDCKPEFKEWMLSKEYIKHHYFSPTLYYHYYHVYEDVITNNTDYIAAVCGIEGSGKSTKAIQAAYLLDPNFTRQNMILNLDKFRERLQEQLDNDIKGRCYVIDEGINVAGTEKGRKWQNVQFNELLRKCRFLNNYIFVCMPDFKGLTPYVRKHRVKNVYYIFDNTKGWRSINVWSRDGLWILNEQLDKGMMAKSIRRRPPYMWTGKFHGLRWPPIPNMDRDKYEEFKKSDLQQSLDTTKERIQEDGKSEYITLRQARTVVPVSDDTLKAWIKKGKVKGKKMGLKYFIQRESLESLG